MSIRRLLPGQLVGTRDRPATLGRPQFVRSLTVLWRPAWGWGSALQLRVLRCVSQARSCPLWRSFPPHLLMGPKKMPAATEKKYLSYSVRALRPNGGIDPMPRQMRREALEASVHGFTLDDPVQSRTAPWQLHDLRPRSGWWRVHLSSPALLVDQPWADILRSGGISVSSLFAQPHADMDFVVG